MGIGNTTPAAALVAGILGLEPVAVVGRGTGIDDAGWMRKTTAIRDALQPGPQERRTRSRRPHPGRRRPGSRDARRDAGPRRHPAHPGHPRRHRQLRRRAGGRAHGQRRQAPGGSPAPARPSRRSPRRSPHSASNRCWTSGCGSARAPARCWRSGSSRPRRPRSPRWPPSPRRASATATVLTADERPRRTRRRRSPDPTGAAALRDQPAHRHPGRSPADRACRRVRWARPCRSPRSSGCSSGSRPRAC